MKQIKIGSILVLVLSLTATSNNIAAMNNKQNREITPENSPTSAILCCGLFGEQSSDSNEQVHQDRPVSSLKKKHSKKLPVAQEDQSIHAQGESIEIAQTAPVRAYSVTQAEVIGMYEDDSEDESAEYQPLQPTQRPNRMAALLARLRGGR